MKVDLCDSVWHTSAEVQIRDDALEDTILDR